MLQNKQMVICKNRLRYSRERALQILAFQPGSPPSGSHNGAWPPPAAGGGPRAARGARGARPLNMLATCCSISAVSAPIFASRYPFFSVFWNLQDYLAAFIRFSKTLKFAKFASLCSNLRKSLIVQNDFWEHIEFGAVDSKRCKRVQIL